MTKQLFKLVSKYMIHQNIGMKINAGLSGFRKNSFESKMRISIENDEGGEEEVLLCFVIYFYWEFSHPLVYPLLCF